MVVVTPPALPHLGETRNTSWAQPGRSQLDRSAGEPEVEAVTYQGIQLLVLFAHNRAVAIRCPFALYQPRLLDHPVQPADLRARGADRPRIFVADRGWIVATEQCEPAALRRLAALEVLTCATRAGSPAA